MIEYGELDRAFHNPITGVVVRESGLTNGSESSEGGVLGVRIAQSRAAVSSDPPALVVKVRSSERDRTRPRQT